MRSTFLPFSPPLIEEDEIDAVVDTLRSDWITTGPKVRKFESAFAEYLGVAGALAVSSCTDALQIALAAVGVGRGDAVFTTTMTFCATAHVVEHLGATPILVDIEPDTLNISPIALEKAIEHCVAEGRLRAVAVMPVHHSGHPCEMGEIVRIAERFGLAIVEDAAHALPATFAGTRIGSTGTTSVPRAVAFSFYATKNLTTAEGGMLTGTPELLDEARLWALHGMSRDAWNRYGRGGSWFYEVVRPGYKCNMTDIQAAVGIQQLRKLDRFQDRRRSVLGSYQRAFELVPEVQRPIERPDVSHAWHLYVLRLELQRLTIDRAAFIQLLADNNIGASVHFIPVHVHPFYRDKYGFKPDDFPVAWSEYQRMVSLPLNPRLSVADVDDVIEAVVNVVAAHRR